MTSVALPRAASHEAGQTIFGHPFGDGTGLVEAVDLLHHGGLPFGPLDAFAGGAKAWSSVSRLSGEDDWARLTSVERRFERGRQWWEPITPLYGTYDCWQNPQSTPSDQPIVMPVHPSHIPLAPMYPPDFDFPTSVVIDTSGV
eukprot:scaffold12139_cov111-Isochrysis_galbana.AAC.1